MIFTSIEFFIFFAIVCVLMLLTNLLEYKSEWSHYKINRIRHMVLLVASYVFYAWWDWRFCMLMFALTGIAYQSALGIERGVSDKSYLVVGIMVPLVVLGVFKYLNFFLDSFYTVFQISNPGNLNVILPVGISFYTFQLLSYTIDVYRKKIPANKDFMKLALYIAFFPQLVAGPIVKASLFLPQLNENRRIKAENVARGVQIFVFGLAKKVVLSDHISIYVDQVFDKPQAFDWLTLVLAVLSYSIQIYLDFSGYADMAIGCALILGYDLASNFNMPYVSRNVTEFWKRWHISLSSWLQEYLYIPLGGNRKGVARTYMNLLITMLLGGLWHGASWNFVIWGGLHGIALCIHKIWSRLEVKKNVVYEGASWIITMIFVGFAWIFFRAETLEKASVMILRIVSLQDGVRHLFSWTFVGVIVLFLSSFVAVIKSRRDEWNEGFYPYLDLSKFTSLVLFFVSVGMIVAFAYTGSNPFIYFQF